MKKMKNDNKGFTLVELIVVLVILAILAAILVPSLLGYIDEAKQKQLVLHGKSVYTAAQATASGMYAKNKLPYDDTAKSYDGTDSCAKYFKDQVEKISEISTFGDSTNKAGAYITFKTQTVTTNEHELYTVDSIIYYEGDTCVKLDSTTNSWESIDKPTLVPATGKGVQTVQVGTAMTVAAATP